MDEGEKEKERTIATSSLDNDNRRYDNIRPKEISEIEKERERERELKRRDRYTKKNRKKYI